MESWDVKHHTRMAEKAPRMIGAGFITAGLLFEPAPRALKPIY
jgi:hypothetical protein